MPRKITQNDFLDLLAVKTNFKRSTVERIWVEALKSIVSELQNNGSINLSDYGEIRTKVEGGIDEWFTNELGVRSKKYIPPKLFVDFIPSKGFIDLVNGERISNLSIEEVRRLKADNHKKSAKGLDKTNGLHNKPYSYDDVVSEVVSQTSKVDDAVMRLVKKRKEYANYAYAKAHPELNLGEGYELSGREHNAHRIYCETNDTEYESVSAMARDLDIKSTALYMAIKRGQTECYGYKFKLLD
jgi:nucleoid DNA-binding protein